MNEQKRISNWLTTAGVEAPVEPNFPKNENLQLALELILEELIEAAESASDEEANKFFDHASTMIAAARFKMVGRNREEGDLMELRDACADMRVVMGNLIHFAGIKEKFNEDFNEVMNSNFSKFCYNEEQAQESVEAYAKGTHPNKMGEVIECYYEKVDDYWIIKRKKGKKVLKSIGFVEPNFK